MRFTFTEEDSKKISLALLKTYKEKDHTYIKLKQQIEDNFNRDITKKTKSVTKATRVRSQKAKEKVENAINLLRLEDKKINANAIATLANIHYSTASKYLKILNNQKS